MKRIFDDNKKINKTMIMGMTAVTAVVFAVLTPMIAFAESGLDDAVETANKNVSAPAAMIMVIALLVMCLVGKKFYKK